MERNKSLKAELRELIEDMQEFLKIYEENPNLWDAAGAASLRTVAQQWRAQKQTLTSRVRVQQEEAMQMVALQSKISRVCKVANNHYSHVHNLKEFVSSMQTLACCENIMKSNAQRLDFALKLKSAFELVLLALSKHFNVAGYKAAGSLAEYIQLLKPHFQPPSRINPYYELKDLVNHLAHPKDTDYKIGLSELEDALHVFLKVVEDGATMLPASSGSSSNSSSTQVLMLKATDSVVDSSLAASSSNRKTTKKKKKSFDPVKEKTKLCKHWQATGSCPYAECHFAHSIAELRGPIVGTRPVPAAATPKRLLLEPRILCSSVYTGKQCPHKACRFEHQTSGGLDGALLVPYHLITHSL